MRYPLWILNGALLVLGIGVLFFIWASRQTLPDWEEIEPESPVVTVSKKKSEINIAKIYDFDLFDSYVRQVSEKVKPTYTEPFPQPPQPQAVVVPKEPTPKFLEPLNVVLKGIVAMSSDSAKNRAIISDARTKKEAVHKVGDIIEDAQLIKIFNNKVIFLRANGQQEVLYLRESDAQSDPAYAVISGWDSVVEKVTDNRYIVSVKEFAKRVQTLAQFIDLLDLTTVYKQGKAIGVRVGFVGDDSLGAALGLQPGDVIVEINGVPVSSTENRFAIYKDIQGMKTDAEITVRVVRENNPLAFEYSLSVFLPKKKGEPARGGGDQPVATEDRQHQEKLKMLQERHKFAPTLSEIRKRDQEMMLEKGRLPRNNLAPKENKNLK